MDAKLREDIERLRLITRIKHACEVLSTSKLHALAETLENHLAVPLIPPELRERLRLRFVGAEGGAA
jgi:hypothetical protein